MSDKNIRIEGELYSPEELGLERIVADGHTYLDVTPFWIDSGQAQHIRQIVINRQPGKSGSNRKGENGA